MDTTTATGKLPRKARGFTMIELVIVLAIAAILAMWGVPSFRTMIASQRMKTASFDLIAMMTITRSEAIKRNTEISATPNNSDWLQGWVVAPTTAPTQRISQQGAMHANDITITCLDSSNNVQTCAPIRYNASGRLANLPGQSIQIFSTSISANNPTENTRCIKMTLGGRPISKKGPC